MYTHTGMSAFIYSVFDAPMSSCMSLRKWFRKVACSLCFGQLLTYLYICFIYIYIQKPCTYIEFYRSVKTM